MPSINKLSCPMLKASLNRQPEKPVIDVHQSTQLTLATWQFNII